MVTFDIKFQDVVYNEDTWPAYCELRDWVFHEKKKRASDDDNN